MNSPLQKRPKKLLDQVREAMRLKHYVYRTAETYVQWIRRYILFHNKRHPKELGQPEIEAFFDGSGRKSAGCGLNSKSGAQCCAVSKPCLSPEVEFCLRDKLQFRAELGMTHNIYAKNEPFVLAPLP